jgi:membrane-associated phospholipid phosphatase
MTIIGTLLLYVVIIAFLAITDRFVFINKSTVVPILFLVAALTRSFVPFVRDWSVFLSAVVLFDGIRGFIYYLINTRELNVYLNYIIDWERALFGGAVPTIWLQSKLFADQQFGLLEKAMTIVHGSHFMAFLLFGFFIWYLRREEFSRYRAGILIVMYGGLAGYFLVPTIPPWMAADKFDVLPEMQRIITQVYNVRAPFLRRVFDNNQIAAMPSLHSAFPAFIALMSLRIWGRRGLIFVAYFAAMIFALVYGGEHYILDVAAGVILAVVAYFLVTKPLIPAHITARLQWGIRGQVIAAVILLIMAESMSQVSSRNYSLWEPNKAFARSELVGHSPKAYLILGGFAFNEEEYKDAQGHFLQARKDLQHSDSLPTAEKFLAISAFYNSDFQTVISVSGARPLADLSLREAFMLARSNLAVGRGVQAMAVYQNLEQIHGPVAALLVEKNTLCYPLGLVSVSDVEMDIRRLGSMQNDPESKRGASQLQQMISGSQ